MQQHIPSANANDGIYINNGMKNRLIKIYNVVRIFRVALPNRISKYWKQMRIQIYIHWLNSRKAHLPHNSFQYCWSKILAKKHSLSQL